jgi:hypothetical protein
MYKTIFYVRGARACVCVCVCVGGWVRGRSIIFRVHVTLFFNEKSAQRGFVQRAVVTPLTPMMDLEPLCIMNDKEFQLAECNNFQN